MSFVCMQVPKVSRGSILCIKMRTKLVTFRIMWHLLQVLPYFDGACGGRFPTLRR